MPTHLFAGKEPAAHFLNLLGLPVTALRVAQVRGESGVNCQNGEHRPVLASRRVGPGPGLDAQPGPEPASKEGTLMWRDRRRTDQNLTHTVSGPLSAKKVSQGKAVDREQPGGQGAPGTQSAWRNVR